MVDEALVVNATLAIPASELDWEFSPSGGPGGQHANRSSTRVELRFDVAASPTLTDGQRRRLLDRVGDEVRVVADDHRSQHRNRKAARDRLAARLRDALAPPPAARRRTKPTKGSVRRRLDAKSRRGEVKKQRRRPDW